MPRCSSAGRALPHPGPSPSRFPGPATVTCNQSNNWTLTDRQSCGWCGSGLSVGLCNEGSQLHSCPDQGVCRRQPIGVSLPHQCFFLSPSHPSTLPTKHQWKKYPQVRINHNKKQMKCVYAHGPSKEDKSDDPHFQGDPEDGLWLS
uniref:Uncharacterized protein n=1 Tax=Molossus molossus TaxID=27622 RepID=A0A7J8DTZ2_MOLMO|nr:hypothetical protein HJG59_009193 [Molossus molossus]